MTNDMFQFKQQPTALFSREGWVRLRSVWRRSCVGKINRQPALLLALFTTFRMNSQCLCRLWSLICFHCCILIAEQYQRKFRKSRVRSRCWYRKQQPAHGSLWHDWIWDQNIEPSQTRKSRKMAYMKETSLTEPEVNILLDILTCRTVYISVKQIPVVEETETDQKRCTIHGPASGCRNLARWCWRSDKLIRSRMWLDWTDTRSNCALFEWFQHARHIISHAESCPPWHRWNSEL